MNYQLVKLLVVSFAVVVGSAVVADDSKSEKLVQKDFKVPLNFFQYIKQQQADVFKVGPRSTPTFDSCYQGFLAENGITIGAGCGAVFNPEEGVLTVISTPDQLELISRIIAGIPKLSVAEEREMVSEIVSDQVFPAEALVEVPEIVANIKKIKAIQIPHLKLHNKGVFEALEIIREKSVEFDIHESDPDKAGVVIIVSQTVNGVGIPFDPTDTINIDIKNATLADVITKSVSQVGGKYVVEPHAIVIVGSSYPDLKVVTMKYTLPKHIYKGMMDSAVGLDPFGPQTEHYPPLLKVLESVGVFFTCGTHARYNKTTREMIVTNSPMQIKYLETYLSSLDEGKMIFGRNSRFHKAEE